MGWLDGLVTKEVRTVERLGEEEIEKIARRTAELVLEELLRRLKGGGDVALPP